MSYERAYSYLKEKGLEDRIILFEVSSATVALAAKALGCEEARIAKSIALEDGDATILVVAAGDVKIDNQKFKQTFHMKARMVSHGEAEERTGHAVGGVCPFGVKENVRVYLDKSLERFDIVYPAAGTSSSAVKLHVSELEALFGQRVDVTKPMA